MSLFRTDSKRRLSRRSPITGSPSAAAEVLQNRTLLSAGSLAGPAIDESNGEDVTVTDHAHIDPSITQLGLQGVFPAAMSDADSGSVEKTGPEEQQPDPPWIYEEILALAGSAGNKDPFGPSLNLGGQEGSPAKDGEDATLSLQGIFPVAVQQSLQIRKAGENPVEYLKKDGSQSGSELPPLAIHDANDALLGLEEVEHEDVT